MASADVTKAAFSGGSLNAMTTISDLDCFDKTTNITGARESNSLVLSASRRDFSTRIALAFASIANFINRPGANLNPSQATKNPRRESLILFMMMTAMHQSRRAIGSILGFKERKKTCEYDLNNFSRWAQAHSSLIFGSLFIIPLRMPTEILANYSRDESPEVTRLFQNLSLCNSRSRFSSGYEIVSPDMGNTRPQIQCGSDIDKNSTSLTYDSSEEENDTTLEDAEEASLSLWQDDTLSLATSSDQNIVNDEHDQSHKVVMREVLLYDEKGSMHSLTCLLDTGATIDCISEIKARELQFKHSLRKLKAPVKVHVANGQNTSVQHVVKARWRFADNPNIYKQRLHVVKNLPYDIIISRQTIFQSKFLSPNIDFSSTIISNNDRKSIKELFPLGLIKLSSEQTDFQNKKDVAKTKTTAQLLEDEWKSVAKKIMAKKKALQDKRRQEISSDSSKQ
ncbi:hypothetical protein BS50DRAFT_674431 [Corynespora cassiicola Philippines]|uniref:Uncharacterized protein n=1 Tax=Corynespora cassiicola Philippines TaxID=1448308 RepID=A0A2T2NWX9_CORCC|nr:hypothetical protein BS50DRAFT_674431 [Corynespora cassiicola Philippines]